MGKPLFDMDGLYCGPEAYDFWPDNCIPGCITPGEHDPDECYTEQQAAIFYAQDWGEALSWRFREPFYTIRLLWQCVRHPRWKVPRTELRFHWHTEFKLWLWSWVPYRIRIPRKCADCGKRFGQHSNCLPF